MNSFGRNFRISVFGESHGEMIGVVIDGVPAGISLDIEDFTEDLLRRKAGARGTTPRIEGDIPRIVSGVHDDITTGAPLTIVFANENTRSDDYSLFRNTPRPGHADFVAQAKHNFYNDIRGGGHFSGRMTLPLVAAGVVAKKVLEDNFISEEEGFSLSARLVEVGGSADSKAWPALIESAMSEGDSLGGIVECVCKGVDVGYGEPMFDSMESQISHLAFSVPGVRGVEFGDGFRAARMKGSEHNDCYIDSEGHTATNGAGGINGGITNGNPIVFRVAIKPTSSISKVQRTYDFIKEEMVDFSVPGRHDTCIALRCPVIIEAITAIVLADNVL